MYLEIGAGTSKPTQSTFSHSKALQKIPLVRHFSANAQHPTAVPYGQYSASASSDLGPHPIKNAMN